MHSNKISRYFPSSGERVHVFMADLSLPSDLAVVANVTADIRAQSDIVTAVESWHDSFREYYEGNFGETDGEKYLVHSETLTIDMIVVAKKYQNCCNRKQLPMHNG